MIQAEGENIRREETQLKAYTIAYTIHRWGGSGCTGKAARQSVIAPSKGCLRCAYDI